MVIGVECWDHVIVQRNVIKRRKQIFLATTTKFQMWMCCSPQRMTEARVAETKSFRILCPWRERKKSRRWGRTNIISLQTSVFCKSIIWGNSLGNYLVFILFIRSFSWGLTWLTIEGLSCYRDVFSSQLFEYEYSLVGI